MKIFYILLIGLFLFGGIGFWIYNFEKTKHLISKDYQPPQFSKENLYQGPVPEGYDEQFFRKTGINKFLKENDS